MTPPDPGDNLTLASVSGARRLTRREYANTAAALLGAPLSDANMALYPENPATVFANRYQDQVPSRPLVDGAETLAERMSAMLLAPARRDAFVGCRPSGTQDAACARDFLRRFGRRVWRRPVRPEEEQLVVGKAIAFAGAEGDFYRGIELIVRALLQDPEFLHRIEIGDPSAPDVRKLTPHEVATRLAYLFWEAPPEDRMELPIATLADRGQLRAREQVREAARTMLASAAGQTQLKRFHALWMRYDDQPATEPGRMETDALVDRIVLKEKAQRTWLDLFTFGETYVNRDLAVRYGLPPPASGQRWVPYGGTPRKGLLSHGGVMDKTGDEDEVAQIFRGKFVLETFACIDVPEPDAATLMLIGSTPPAPGRCKSDRSRARMAPGTCSGACHLLIESAGMGLDNFDSAGAFRTVEPADATCSISGDGEILGVGKFNGLVGKGGLPGMADLLISSRRIDSCGVKQLLRFTFGRDKGDETAGDAALLDAMLGKFRDGRHSFEGLVLDLASSEAFRYRKTLAMEAP